MTKIEFIIVQIMIVAVSVVCVAIAIELATGLPARRAIEGWFR